MTGYDAPNRIDPSAVELRPSGRDYARRVLPAVPLAAPLIGGRVWAQSRSLLAAVAVVGGVVLVVGVLVLAFLREARWSADADGVRARGLFGRERSVPRSAVVSVLLATRFRAGRARPGVFLALRDEAGRGLLRLQGPAWDVDDIVRFLDAARLGPLTRVDEPTDAVLLGRSYPGAQSRAAEHPGKVALITLAVIGGLLLLVFGGGALLSNLGG